MPTLDLDALGLGRVFWPYWMPRGPAAGLLGVNDGGLVSSNIAAGAAYAFPLPVAETGFGSLVGLDLRINAVTTPGDAVIRIETVGADGFPTGTLWSPDAEGGYSLTSGDAGTMIHVDLASAAVFGSGDRGAYFALVIQSEGAAFSIYRRREGHYPGRISAPKSRSSGGSWGDNPSQVASLLIGGLQWADGWRANPFCQYVYPLSGTVQYTSSLEVGGRLTVPVAGVVAGVALAPDRNPPSVAVVNVYDAGNTLLAQAEISSASTQDGSNLGQIRYITFPGPLTVAADDVLYVGLYRTSGSNNAALQRLYVPDAGRRALIPGADRIAWAERTPAGSGTWSIDTDYVPGIALAYAEIEAGGGGTRRVGLGHGML